MAAPAAADARVAVTRSSTPGGGEGLVASCHIDRGEEELHRVQAMMRKLERRAGAESVAVLSVAAKRGAAAPIGVGAAEQRGQVVEVSI